MGMGENLPPVEEDVVEAVAKMNIVPPSEDPILDPRDLNLTEEGKFR